MTTKATLYVETVPRSRYRLVIEGELAIPQAPRGYQFEWAPPEYINNRITAYVYRGQALVYTPGPINSVTEPPSTVVVNKTGSGNGQAATFDFLVGDRIAIERRRLVHLAGQAAKPHGSPKAALQADVSETDLNPSVELKLTDNEVEELLEKIHANFEDVEEGEVPYFVYVF